MVTPAAPELQLLPAQPGDYAVLPGWIPDATACARWAGPLLKFPLNPATLAEDLAVGGSTSYFLRTADAAAGAEASATRPPLRLLGFGQHRIITPGAVHLGRILIAPGARGNGLGRVLCTRLIVRAVAATGAAHVTLRVYRDNPAAIALYQQLGFEIIAAESDEAVFFMRASVAAITQNAQA